MPPIDPNRPLAFDPSEPRGPTTYTGMVNEPLDAPALSQQQVDLSGVLRQNFDALASLSTQIARNLGGTEDLLRGNVNHIENMVSGTRRLVAQTREEALQQRQIHEFSLARKTALEQVLDIEKNIRSTQGGNLNNLRQQFQLGGMLTRKGNISFMDEQNRPQEMSIEQYMKLPDQQRRSIRDQLSTSLATNRPETASVSQVIQALAHGNIGSAIGELMQSFPQLAGVSTRLRTAGAGLEARGIERGGLSGLAQRGAGMLVGEGLPFALSPAGAIMAVRELRQSIRGYQEDLRQGMQGGLQGNAAARETIGANLRARVEGLNPFDALTTQMARQIAAGIQSEGFTGSIRAAWQDSVTDVVKSTGVDAGTALQLMTTSANQLGESATQFRQDMNLVQNAAKNTSFSVTQLAQNMQQLQQSFVQRGGIQASAPVGQLANTLQNALGNTQLGRTALQGLTSVIGQPQVWQQAVTMAGINPLLANTQETLRRAPQILDEYGKRLWDIKNQGPGKVMKLHEWVVMMYAAGLFNSLLPGADEATVEEFMRITSHGGLEQTQSKHTAENAPGPQGHHRGFLGGIFHGAYHGITVAGHGIESGIGAVDTGIGHLVAGAAGEVGASASTQRAIRRQMSGLPSWLPQTSVYNDYSVTGTQQRQIQYWRDQAQAMGLSAAQTRRLLEPTRQATNIDALEQANTQAQTVIVKLHPQAAKYFSAEPANVQRYYDALYGRSGSQNAQRPPGGGR